MNNEELVEEIRKLRNEIGLLRTELRAYISNNEIDNEVINKATKEEVDNAIDDVVYGSTQANPDEPKDIVLKSVPKVDDSIIYGSDSDNYFSQLNKNIFKENINPDENNKEVSSQAEVPEEDRSMYIPGTNILKPRNRDIYETDEEYVKYLEEYYEKYFPTKDFKGLANIDPNEPKGLALLDDVKKTDEIKSVEDAIDNLENKESEDSIINAEKSKSVIPDNYDLDGAPKIGGDEYDKYNIIDANSHPEVLDFGDENEPATDKSDDKSEVIEFASEEEREAFEKAQETDYKKNKESNTKKIGKIRKAVKSFKEILKKHGKKIIAGVLVAVATIGAAMSVRSCNYDNQDSLSDSKDNPKSNSDEYDSTIPSVSAADSFEKVPDFEKEKDREERFHDVESGNHKDDRKLEKKRDINNFYIGEPVEFTGESFYETSYNAENNIEPLTPYYSKEDEREISAVEYKSPNGEQYVTAVTEKEQEQLESMGWIPVSYNMKNNTRSNDGNELKYEAWVNPSDIEEVKSK